MLTRPRRSGGGGCGEGVGGLALAVGVVGGEVWRRLGTGPTPSVFGLPFPGLSHTPASFGTTAPLRGLSESRPSCGLWLFPQSARSPRLSQVRGSSCVLSRVLPCPSESCGV